MLTRTNIVNLQTHDSTKLLIKNYQDSLSQQLEVTQLLLLDLKDVRIFPQIRNKSNTKIPQNNKKGELIFTKNITQEFSSHNKQ